MAEKKEQAEQTENKRGSYGRERYEKVKQTYLDQGMDEKQASAAAYATVGNDFKKTNQKRAQAKEENAKEPKAKASKERIPIAMPYEVNGKSPEQQWADAKETLSQVELPNRPIIATLHGNVVRNGQHENTQEMQVFTNLKTMDELMGLYAEKNSNTAFFIGKTADGQAVVRETDRVQTAKQTTLYTGNFEVAKEGVTVKDAKAFAKAFNERTAEGTREAHHQNKLDCEKNIDYGVLGNTCMEGIGATEKDFRIMKAEKAEPEKESALKNLQDKDTKAKAQPKKTTQTKAKTQTKTATRKAPAKKAPAKAKKAKEEVSIG